MSAINNSIESTWHTPSESDVELSIPMVEASPIGDNQTVSPSPPTAKVRVKVTAPLALPPGFIIQILYQEKGRRGIATKIWKKAVVKVPVDCNGVEKGQVFEAETQPFDTVKQIRGDWDRSKVDFDVCCNSVTTDTEFCLLSWFCSPVAWACLFEQLVDLKKENFGLSIYRPRFVAKSIGLVSLLFVVLSLVSKASGTATTASSDTDEDSRVTTSPVYGMVLVGFTSPLSFVFLVFGMFVRSKIREYYSIRGNCIEDFLAVMFCSTCSVLQTYHHMKKAHEHPLVGHLNEPLTVEAEKMV
ncbi:unnamed protein product [Cylindrotheca closterium]|uniref:Uncharacterized protein n=1 Tax=Cylindrotheca closterium TaxID=2856 RepID=A0AAD2FZK1_9STRA|nr:unnamed protein product [Cylindrotheca closterium]